MKISYAMSDLDMPMVVTVELSEEEEKIQWMRHFVNASLSFNGKKYEEAIDEILMSEILLGEVTFNSNLFRGMVLFQQEKFKQALKFYRKAQTQQSRIGFPFATIGCALSHLKMEELENALHAFDLALQNTEYDHSDVLYYKASVLFESEQYREAADCFSLVLSCCLSDMYSKVFFYKGQAHFFLKEFELATSSLTDAENYSSEKKYPEASYFKGQVFLELNQLADAVSSFTKAEDDSLNSNYPQASYQKGISLKRLGLFKEAIQSFQKASNDQSDDGYPQALYEMGRTFELAKQPCNAIQAYELAELKSPNYNYPAATYYRGNLLEDLHFYPNAIHAFEKAEKDSAPDTFPQASLEKGNTYGHMGKFNDSIAAFTKAELGSTNGKYPSASINKGSAYHHLKNYEQALESFSKAERDSVSGRCPDASYLKARVYHELRLFPAAILSYTKAALDSDKKIYPLAYLGIAQCYWELGKKEESFQAALQAVAQDNRNWEIVNFILECTSNSKAAQLYENRLNYLWIASDQITTDESIVLTHFNNLWVKSNDVDLSLKMFCMVLQETYIEIPFDLVPEDRLRLAYLIYYSRDEPHYAYEIISRMRQREFQLNSMDYYFFLLCAYKIGDSFNEMNSIGSEITDIQSPFSASVIKLRAAISEAFEKGKKIDGNLLDLDLSEFVVSKELVKPAGYHPWIYGALLSAIDPGVEYALPVSGAILPGLLSQVYLKSSHDLGFDLYKDDLDLKNLINSLSSPKHLDYGHILKNVRIVIRKGIPYLLVLNILFELYASADDSSIKSGIARIQAATLASNYFDFRNRSIYKDAHLEISTNCVVDLLAHESIGMLITYGLIGNLGIGVAVAYLTSKTLDLLHEERERSINDILEDIIFGVE